MVFAHTFIVSVDKERQFFAVHLCTGKLCILRKKILHEGAQFM